MGSEDLLEVSAKPLTLLAGQLTDPVRPMRNTSRHETTRPCIAIVFRFKSSNIKGRIMEIVYHFDTASAALRACEKGNLVTGSVLVIASDCIVALASAAPHAITEYKGPFKPFLGKSRSEILAESRHSPSEIRAGVDEAYRHGFPVAETLADFATLRSEMSPCAREFRLTSDEVLALVEAADARSSEFRNRLSGATPASDAGSVLRRSIAVLASARCKLLNRPL